MCLHLKTLWKTKENLFDFLKVSNELGKVKKFRNSRPLFSWWNSLLKKVRAYGIVPPAHSFIHVSVLCHCKKSFDILGLINTTDSYVCFDKVGLSAKMILGWWLSFAFNYFLIALKGNLLLSLKMYKFWIRFSKICLWDAFNHLLQMPTFKIHQIWVALIILSKYSMDGCKCEHPASY